MREQCACLYWKLVHPLVRNHFHGSLAACEKNDRKRIFVLRDFFPSNTLPETFWALLCSYHVFFVTSGQPSPTEFNGNVLKCEYSNRHLKNKLLFPIRFRCLCHCPLAINFCLLLSQTRPRKCACLIKTCSSYFLGDPRSFISIPSKFATWFK